MTYGQAILLGFVQGVAEFLPISSSGHLAVLQNFLAIGDMENHLLFDVLLHLGTLAAVFLALRGEISPLWNEGLRMLHLKKTRRGEEPDGVKRRMIWFLQAAKLPLALAAVLNKYVESLYQNTFFIGFAFLMTGVLLFAADRMGHGNKNERGATLGDAVVVGLAQMLAVVPGLSRSGTTISAGLLRGFDRNFAVKFSFLLSIPAVLGANLVSGGVRGGGRLVGGAKVSRGRACRVRVGLFCHLSAAHDRAARKIRRICVLLLGRGIGDADPVADSLRRRNQWRKSKQKKQQPQRAAKRRPRRRHSRSPSAARSARACACCSRCSRCWPAFRSTPHFSTRWRRSAVA